MFGLRAPELIIILIVLVLMFGTKKIPDLGEALGKGIRAFKKASDAAFDKDEPCGPTPKAQQGELPSGSPHASPSSRAERKTSA